MSGAVAAETGPVTVAAFDVDGTLTTRDCVVPFLRRVAGTAPLVGRLLRRPDRLLGALARRDRDGLKHLAAAAAFAGRPVAEVERLGVEHAADVAANWLCDPVVAELRAHVDRGDEVVLVSASFEVYLRPLATSLGASGVLGTRLDDDAGRLTGRLEGANCRGAEKVRRLHGWLDDHHGGRTEVRLVAYGDSAGDREMLADADAAHWVRRGRIARVAPVTGQHGAR